MKRLLPAGLKSFLWFVFKSPQRRMAGWQTLLTDIKGYCSLLFRKQQKLKPVSICTGLKNRSEAYINYVLGSLKEVMHPELIELSVYDCGSDDAVSLEHKIREQWKGRLVFYSEQVPFSRAKAFNCAIRQAGNNLIFACDADISLPPDIVKKINRYTGPGRVWFPVVNWLDSEGKGRFFTEGTGMFAAEKQQFELAGAYDERITDWGKEDWLLFFAFYRVGIMPFRSREAGIRHHWHKSLKPLNFKPLF